ncbi:MAG: Uma2 family endonuclease [Candidatus Contendobacter sp.]
MTALTQSFYTPEQYLALERQANYKSEYVNGSIFAMAGASKEHNQIAFNIAGELHGQLKNRPCLAYVNDLRVKVNATGLYTYPDVAALCGEPQFEDEQMDTLLNPSVIIEILSPSTEAYDRGDKFAHYRRLPSLMEYVLIAQNKVRVEHYIRQDNKWVLTEMDSLDETLCLASIQCEIPLREIYAKVDLPVVRHKPQ